jgi:hypothetical protein
VKKQRRAGIKQTGRYCRNGTPFMVNPSKTWSPFKDAPFW